MSNRKTLIDALRQITSATLPELVDATGWPERKVRDTISDCKTAGLVSSERDDVTGKPLYRLTKAGAAWQPPKMGRPVVDAKPQPAEGTISPAPRDREPPKDHASPEARGVVEPPKPVQKPARASSDEIERMHVAIAEFCAWLHEKTGVERCPMNLPECAEIIERRLAEGEARIAALESNAELPLRTHTNGVRYAVAFPSDFHDSPESAMAQALFNYETESLKESMVIACEPVGRIELRPMLVPV